MKLKDKVALVTGAGQGMGRAIARRFAAEGATVVALDLDPAKAEQTLTGLAGSHLVRQLDVSDAQAVDTVVAEVLAQLGRIDVLVNNAGMGGPVSFTEMTDETWARVMGVNLNGPFYCARAAVRAMQKNGAGVVINVGSTSAFTGEGPAHYVTSKAALLGLTRVMARELAATGIRVNTLVPGPTNTPMLQSIPKEWADAIVATVPLGRMAEPEEIADAALFLASEDSRFITGQSLSVNGGSTFI